MINVLDQVIKDNYSLYNGDSVDVLGGIPDSSIHYSIFSPPFASLYTYTNSERDLGNSRTRKEFYRHFKFIIKELYRVMMPGRLVSVHCMDIPAMKERDGFIGLVDFPGQIKAMFGKEGFIYHSKVTIPKDPLVEATRTKALGLLHKTIQRDSAMCRNGIPDELITFRKPGENPEPISHPDGFIQFIGADAPNAPKIERPNKDMASYNAHRAYNNKPVYSHQVWRRYANSVWYDIDQSNTLNRNGAREEKDERHICPLQLDVIGRALELWSNPGDIILTPFLGVGSEVYQAILMNRRAVGVELKKSYFQQAVINCEQAVIEKSQISLFEPI